MKRDLVIAAVTAAALACGGAYTAAVAMTADHGASTASPTPVAPAAPIAVGDGSADDGPTDDGARSAARSRTDLTAGEAAAAALKQYPGAVSSVERDDDRDNHFEIGLFGKGDRLDDLNVDASTGRVTADRDDNDDDDDQDDNDERAALRAATVNVREAAAAALRSVPGTVTSAEIDDDRTADNGRWEVEVRGEDGRTHELNVHAKTGKVTADRDDDRQGDRYDDDRHDSNDNDSDSGYDG